MKRKEKKRGRWKRRILLICVLILLIPTAYYGIDFIYRGQTEPKVSAQQTNTDAAVYTLEEFMDRLEPYRGLYEETIVKHEDEIDSGTYTIPGLKATLTVCANADRKPTACGGMTPQGITVSDRYLFISAYCHTKTHNSVIYVIDKETHKFVKELVLPNKAHVGSLAYDYENQNLWVCGSRNGVAQVNAISAEVIEKYNFAEEYRPVPFLHVNNILDIPRSSFMTYYQSYLYVGYYSTKGNGVIKKYELQDDGNIQSVRVEYDGEQSHQGVAAEDDLEISRYAQGMTFLGDMLFLSYSMGITPSRLAAYQVSDGIRDYTDKMALQDIHLPYMLEQICMDNGTMYLLFESAAYAYRGLPGISVDRVLKIDILE